MVHLGAIKFHVQNKNYDMGKKRKYPGSYNFFGKQIYVEVNRGNLTSIGSTVQLKIKDTHNTYDLLPQAKIFICFSSNTLEYVLHVQNELLLENLNPHQQVEWIPLAWNVLPPINTRGTSSNAQDIINTYIEKADHIVFIVKDYVADGLRTEWSKFSNHSNGKTVHLGIFANQNEQKVHNELDPLKQIVYFSFKDFNDILLHLKKEIHTEVILTGNEQKLQFVRTKEQLVCLQEHMKEQLVEFKREKANPRIIFRTEELINIIDKKGTEILKKNRKSHLTTPELIELKPVVKPIPTLTTIRHLPNLSLGKGGKGIHIKGVGKIK